MLGLVQVSWLSAATSSHAGRSIYLVIVMRAMREVEASDAHASPQEVFQDFHAARLWTKRADDLQTRTLTDEQILKPDDDITMCWVLHQALV